MDGPNSDIQGCFYGVYDIRDIDSNVFFVLIVVVNSIGLSI